MAVTNLANTDLVFEPRWGPPEIDRFVMAITAVEAEIWHTSIRTLPPK
jgi:hypothetical protein